MSEVKLNIGCGDDIKDGFVNVDIRGGDGVNLVADVQNLHMIPDESVDYILAQDILEHFPFKRTLDILREWCRVLKHRGILKVRVPNLKYLCEHYVEYRDAYFVSYHLYGEQDHKFNYHFVCFDRVWLRNVMIQVGFEEVSYEEPEGTNFIMEVRKV